MEKEGRITELLKLQGQDDARDESHADEVWRLVYPELRRRAKRLFRGERSDHTLSATAVVNEVFLRLQTQEPRDFADRHHFYAVASGMMRNVLIDHARARLTQKRGSGAFKESLDEAMFPALASDDAGMQTARDLLDKLAVKHERPALVVAMRVFGGLTVEETAQELQVSARTVKADWLLARMSLKEMLGS